MLHNDEIIIQHNLANHRRVSMRQILGDYLLSRGIQLNSCYKLYLYPRLIDNNNIHTCKFKSNIIELLTESVDFNKCHSLKFKLINQFIEFCCKNLVYYTNNEIRKNQTDASMTKVT